MPLRDIPYEVTLRSAVERLAADASPRELRQAAERISVAYRARGGRGVSDAGPFGPLAYAVTRMPATHAAVRAVLRELEARCGALVVERMLDLGAGPGTSVWAAAEVFPSLRQATLVESDPTMVSVGRQLLDDLPAGLPVDVTWTLEALAPRSTSSVAALGMHDLVVVAYLLGELEPDERVGVVEAAWKATTGALALIMPGSPEGCRIVLDMRRRLVAWGGSVVAPCPHDGACPLSSDDWCHMATRVARSSLHRRLKGGRLPYEDEKFSYVVVTRGVGSAASARVIRRPRAGGRQVVLTVCDADGVREARIPRSRRDAYRRAKKTAWGDGWE